MLSFKMYVAMLSCLVCATTFVFAYLCFSPRLPAPTMDIHNQRVYAEVECVSATRTGSSWQFSIRNNTSRSFRFSNQDEFSIMISTPEGLRDAGPAVRIDMPVDLPAGETAPVTVHSNEADHFVVLAPRQGLRFELVP
jgi:hypothetical protein